MNTTISSSDNSRTVSFSESSELYLVPACEQEDVSATWYSSQDRQVFRTSMVESIRQVSRDIEDLPMGATMTQEQFTNCLGIESFITKGAARCAAEVRRAHIDAILSEQRCQKQCGTCDIERLSRISQEGSIWTKERAWKLARGYAALS